MQTASNRPLFDDAHQAYTQGRYTDALALVEPLCAGTSFYEAHYLRGVILYRLQRFDEAVTSLSFALTLRGGNATLLNTLAAAITESGGVCLSNNEFAAALLYFEKALRYRQDYLPALLNRAFVLHQLGQFTQALDAYMSALKFLNVDAGHTSITDVKRGDAAQQPAIAPALLERHASLRSNVVKILYNISVIQLTLGNYVAGWRHYGARPSLLALPFASYQQALPQDLSGRRVLVVRDQGLGDEIFFLRYWKLLQDRGAVVHYQPHPKIFRLLQECSDVTVQPPSATIAASDYNFVIAAGDLPTVLQQSAPRSAPLPLRPGTQYSNEIRAALEAAGPPPYIGITWRAGSLAPDNAIATRIRKSIELETMIGGLKSYRGTLCVLQRQPQAEEIAVLKKRSPCAVADFSYLNDDLPRMLSLLDALDDYVGVSNTNMHLRGSLGKSARVLIPFPPEWRWQHSGDTSPWYTHFRLVRQNAYLSWPTILTS